MIPAPVLLDNHAKAVAALHIVCGFLTLLFIAALGLFFGALTVMIDRSWDLYQFFASIGALIALPFVLLAIGQIVAAIYLLQGSTTGRGFVMAFGILHLLNVPIGTALGIYTLWALMRPVPGAALPPA